MGASLLHVISPLSGMTPQSQKRTRIRKKVVIRSQKTRVRLTKTFRKASNLQIPKIKSRSKITILISTTKNN